MTASSALSLHGPGSETRSAWIPAGSAGHWKPATGRPTTLNSGIRGTIPYVAYSPFEIGWALSVQVARTRRARSGGSSRSRSARPMPRACSPGSTNSIDRNHMASRSTADPKATIRRVPATARRSATMNRLGSVVQVWRCNRRTPGLSSWSGGEPSRDS